MKIRKPKPRYPILKELSERFSPRHFVSEPIPQADMQSILEAARWVPSGRNSQPWYFYWTQHGSSVFNALISALPDFNTWAKTASVLIVACGTEKNERGKNEFSLYDLGASVLAMILQGQQLGYYARQMGIFDKEKVKKIVKAKDEEPFVIVALGKLGDYTKADKDIVERDMTPTPRKTDFAKKI
ncbi:MAG: nitroreductase family protein [Atribacterota bacterium]|nr:nitroreductase family protein [Atribacterota bacterium]